MFSPERDQEGRPILRIHAMPEPVNEYARLEGILAISAPVGASEHNFTMPYERLVDGISYFCPTFTPGDKVDFEVHHPTLGLLNQFGKDWYVQSSETIKLYKAKILQDLIIKVRYHNTGASTASMYVNLYFHECLC